MNFEGPLFWTDEAEAALKDTFDGNVELTRNRVQSGQYLLWRTTGGFLVTESFPTVGLVWLICFQGRGALQLWLALAKELQPRGYTRMGCFTRHKAATWLFRKYNPSISVDDSGEYRIEIEIAELCKYGSHGALSSTFDERRLEPQRRRESASDCG